ncbi:flagellar associated protein [Cardiosporidium cionae]|uniref:Cilia- and flagella-associated protein 52 n=1 Tax=Cardiosporidium cionae TaxID=476202 RepID=A0ABQ7JCC9_9APIC|nr:flagellar associated protein [Cardiosporidium cionae]|eukprot:KAF8821614.1 flagellar associated protein [Cardiosporidium cionae]
MKEHQHSVHSLSFSKDGKYLASIGGGTPRKLIIWDIETGRMSCHSKLPITVSVVRLYFDTELYAITARAALRKEEGIVVDVTFRGNNDLHTWYFNKQSGNLVSHKCDVGRFQRDVACISVDTLNRNAYVGTTTGDVLVICLEKSYLKTKSKPSQNLQGGVTCIATWETDHILVGSKLGLLHKMKCSSFAIQQSCEVLGGITSIARAHDGSFYVGTDKSNIYNVNSHSFIPVLMASNHCHRINGVVFPKNYSDLFATFSANDIRLWDGRKLEEALRITVSGNECFALDIAPSGEFILSGWSDGSTKAFLPQSGKLYFEVKDSHQNGVTAVACMSDNSMIVTGGMKGDIRLWCLETMGCVLQEIRREHHAKIILLKLGRKDLKMLSASSDGTIITWDMKTFTPVRSFQEKSSLKSVALHPDESLIISAPANQCISFWNSEGGHKIDELLLDDYSQHKTLAISANGNFILTAGSGGLVRLFDLRSGYPIPLADGIGSSGTAQGCAISPDESYAVTVGDGGSMFRWDLIKS